MRAASLPEPRATHMLMPPLSITEIRPWSSRARAVRQVRAADSASMKCAPAGTVDVAASRAAAAGVQ